MANRVISAVERRLPSFAASSSSSSSAAAASSSCFAYRSSLLLLSVVVAASCLATEATTTTEDDAWYGGGGLGGKESNNNSRRRGQSSAGRPNGELPNYYYAWTAGSNRLGQCGIDPLSSSSSSGDQNLAAAAVISPPSALDSTYASSSSSSSSFGDPPSLVGSVASVSAGESHTILLGCDGTVRAFGRNDFGQLGIGSGGGGSGSGGSISSSTSGTTSAYEHWARDVPLPLGAYKIAAGPRQSFYLLRNGTLFGSGDGSGGALGLGLGLGGRETSGENSTTTNAAGRMTNGREATTTTVFPSPVWIMDRVVDVESNGGTTGGTATTLVRTHDGRVLGFGDNGHGQLGSDNPIEVLAPSPLWAEEGEGEEYEEGGEGEGEGQSEGRNNPLRINVVEMSVGGHHVALLLDDGRTYTAGSNVRGQLLRPSVPRGSSYDGTFRKITALGGGRSNVIRAVKCGGEHTLLLYVAGGDGSLTLRGGGSNLWGQLGPNVPGYDTASDPSTTYVIDADVDERGLVAGFGTTHYGKRGDGTYWGLGMNRDGALGGGGGVAGANGYGGDDSPVRVEGAEYVRDAAAGFAHLVFLGGPPEPSGIGYWSVDYLPDESSFTIDMRDGGDPADDQDDDEEEPEIVLHYLVGRSASYFTATFFAEDCATPAPSDVISLFPGKTQEGANGSGNGGGGGIVRLGDSGNGATEVLRIEASLNARTMVESSVMWTADDPTQPAAGGRLKFCVSVDAWLSDADAEREGGNPLPDDKDVKVSFRKNKFDVAYDVSTSAAVTFAVGGGAKRRERRRAATSATSREVVVEDDEGEEKKKKVEEKGGDEQRRGLQANSVPTLPLSGPNGGALGELCAMTIDIPPLPPPPSPPPTPPPQAAARSGGTRTHPRPARTDAASSAAGAVAALVAAAMAVAAL